MLPEESCPYRVSQKDYFYALMNWTSYLLLISLAIAPGIAISIFIYFKDKYEKEPFWLLVKCFLFGMLAAVAAGLFELVESLAGFDSSGEWISALLFAFFGVSLVEEFCKFFFLRVFAYRKKAFNEAFDGIVYSVMIAMGFATLENVFYALQYGWQTTALRLFTAVPLHATCGVLMGYFVGTGKFKSAPWRFMFLGVFSAVVVHGAYDFFLFQQDYPALAVMAMVSLAGAVTLSFFAIRSHQRNSPFIGNAESKKDDDTGAV